MMSTRLRSRRWTRIGLAGLLTAGVLALLPAAPAAAVQTMAWTTSPPATAAVGGKVSFAATGTANTFLGARITGCFVNFPDGNNYTNSFGGNFTTGNCSYTDRTLSTAGNYTIAVGFNLSNGSTMSLSHTITVQAPAPTLLVPADVTTAATSAQGAVVTYVATASDSYYGGYAPTCTPASGSVFAPGTTTVSCSATNPGGRTSTASFPVVVLKSSPTLLWSLPSTFAYGTTYGDLMTASMQAADATGTITYTGPGQLAPGSLVPVGADQVLTATYVPSGPAASAYHLVSEQRTVTVVMATSAVSFGSGTPTSARYGDAPFPVTVTGTGTGAVTVTAQPGSHCTVGGASTGTSITATVTITGAGACVLLADQAATSTHHAAPTAQWSVTAAKANPQLTWTPPETLTYGDSSSALLGAVADVPGTFAYRVDGVAVAPDTVLDAGDGLVVSVVFSPDQSGDYVEATATRTFSVLPAAQTLTVGVIADRTYGDAPFALDIGGTGPGVVSSAATGACTVDGATVTIVSAGECDVTVARAATSNYLAADPVTRTFSVARAPQTLTVAAIDDRTYGAAPFGLDVGGVGPGEVTASASGSCTVDGLTVSIVSAGECTVTATKAGTDLYLAADPVTRTLAVARAPQTVTLGAIADRTYGAEPFGLDVGGTGPGDVSTSATGSCSVDGLTVTITSAGACDVAVTRAATADYLAASVTRTFSVARAAQTLTVDPVDDRTFGDAPFPLVVGGSGPGDVSASATGACTVDGLTVTVTGAGSCAVTVETAATSNYLAAPPVTRTFSVQPAAQTLTVGAIADHTYGDAPFVLDVGGSGPGAVSATASGACTVAGLTVTLVGSGACAVMVEKAATSNYRAPPPVTRTFSVQPAAQTLTVGAIADRTYGDAPFVLDVGGSGPGAVSAAASGACTVAGLTVTVVGAGACTVTVTRAATATHLAATAVRTFSVARAEQTVTVAAIADRTYGDAPFVLDVGGAGPGAVSAAASGGCTVAGLTVTVASAGSCTVTVTRAATTNYLLVSAARTFTVARAVPTLTWAAPASIVSGVPLGDAQLNASAGRAGTTTYTVDGGSAPARGQVLTVGNHVLHAVFVPTDSLNFTTATAQVPLTVTAPPVVSVPSPAATTVTVTSRGVPTARLRCSKGDTRCTGALKLVALKTQKIDGVTVRKGTVLASRTFALNAGATGAVALTPTAAGRSVLRAKALKKAQLQIGSKVWTVTLSR